MKLIFQTLFVALAGVAFCQSGPVELGDAFPIDIYVSSLEWHPNGKAFLYSRFDGEGKSIGAFGFGKPEGTTILKFKKDDSIQTSWLANSSSAVLVVRGPGGPAHSTSIRIFLVDVDLQTARKIFEDVYESNAAPSVDVDTSPGLKLAIVTLRRGQESRHMLICPNGELINAPDLDRAEAQGLQGPNWSVDGTAVYANPTLPVGDQQNTKQDSANDGGMIFTASLKIDREMVLSLLRAGGNITKPTTVSFVPNSGPPVGSNVLELIPSNAVLRPVRFRGPWVERIVLNAPTGPQTSPVLFQFEGTRTQGSSVWIKRGEGKNSSASFLGVHVSKTWVSPTETAIAYIVDGALFVRTIR